MELLISFGLLINGGVLIGFGFAGLGDRVFRDRGPLVLGLFAAGLLAITAGPLYSLRVLSERARVARACGPPSGLPTAGGDLSGGSLLNAVQDVSLPAALAKVLLVVP
jgi:hypothetical protein